MNIYYVANVRMPTEKAHGLQIMKTCEALAGAGADIELVVPRRKNRIQESPFSYYGIREGLFPLREVFCFDTVRNGFLGFLLFSFSFSLSAIFSLWRERRKSVVYVRDEYSGALFSLLGFTVFFESHDWRDNLFHFVLARRAAGIFPITEGLKKKYLALGLSEKKILVVSDAADLSLFEKTPVENFRKEHGFSESQKIVLYSGHLYEWKGAGILAEAASSLPHISFVFVGGTEEDMETFRKRFPARNIFLLGQKPYSTLPYYFSGADILALPNSGKSDISRFYTSPIKLFDYMASGKPIVASDLPSIREILSEKEAFFFEADTPKSLAEVISFSLENKHEASKRGKAAKEKSREYSWEKRAEKIVDLLTVFR